MFGNTSNTAFRPGSLFGGNSAGNMSVGSVAAQPQNPNKDFEVASPPDDSIQCMRFSPATVPQNFLCSGSWDNLVRVWEVKQDGSTEPKAQQSAGGPVLGVDWSDDGSKIFFASADRQAKMWDLGANQCTQVAQHDAPIKTCHWVKTDKYQCLMTGSWDKTLRFWDCRQANPIMSISLPERVYCADVEQNMAVICTAPRGIIIYQLGDQPQEVQKMESPLKHQHRCVSIFKDKEQLKTPAGFAVGSIEGRVAIQYVSPVTTKDNFTFKCHRSPELVNGFQDIFAVNDIAFHPAHGTLATVGSDGRFSFWDKDARTKLKTSEKVDQSITACCFNRTGDIFAYSVSYDWSRGHEAYNTQGKNHIFLRSCTEEMKPRPKK